MKNIITITIILFLTVSCNTTSAKKKQKNKYVMIETVYGNMIIKLYNKTPLHRDNFIKLVEQNFYDSLLFHRVIKGFMIQGGDPKSKNSLPGERLGEGGPGYKIDAEFNTKFIHKKGALAAAREGDQFNPQKKSSGSQFYIIQGTKITKDRLQIIENKINEINKQDFLRKYINSPENSDLKNRLDSLKRTHSYRELNDLINKKIIKLKPQIDSIKRFKYTEEQKQIYSTIGGAPHLDQNYTVFGEIIDGLNIIDSIANVKVDRNKRPYNDIIMKVKIIKPSSRWLRKNIGFEK